MRSDAWQAWKRSPLDAGQTDALVMAEMQEMLLSPFLVLARPAQRPVLTRDWRTWLFMGGRGAGKTRAGAEFMRYAMLFGGYGRAALVGPALHDVREVMIEGPSGLRAIAPPTEDPPVYEPSRRRLVWPNGAVASAFSAEDPDSLRGPQFDIAWCDEIAVWAKGMEVWNTLQMGLRLGPDPRVVATTTPRPVRLVRHLVADPDTLVTRSSTLDNAAHLAPGFLDLMTRAYGGTHLGRQELEGELVDDPPGALWKRSVIDAARIDAAPALDDTVVAVDPPATSGPRADACGIVAAGTAGATGFGRKAFVIADASARGLSPLDWASRAVALAAELQAGCILAEANQGGEMVRHALETAGCRVPVRLVRAKAGKEARARPVAALYEKGLVAHVGVMKALEDEMCSFGAQGLARSPDRVDALVWALWGLMVERGGSPRVRGLGGQ